jgi:hypothetical protein
MARYTLFRGSRYVRNDRTVINGIFYAVHSEYIAGLDHELGITRVEAGSNTSTVTLRDVGGDEKGSLKYETVIYGHESEGTWPRERLHWRGPAAYTKDRPFISS